MLLCFHLSRDNKMYDVLVSGMGSRRNPLGFIITTAGESRGGTSSCYMFYEYCNQVLSLSVENDEENEERPSHHNGRLLYKTSRPFHS